METKYQVAVEPSHIREQQIAERCVASEETDNFYEYGEARKLPVITLPLATPIYRMANYRTRIAQQSLIRRESKSADFFRVGQENRDAQQIQHDMLVKFAEEGRDGSVTPIVDVLQAEKQRDPLLITTRGVVVNGNRRLAGMRDLYVKDPEQNRVFGHVKCMVLPSTVTEAEIREIEIRLQMKQRTELDYEWINECIAIKELRESGKTIKELMAMMNKKKGEVEEAINALIEADLYLADWAGRSGDYEAIEDAKQLFYDIGDNLKNKSGDSQELGRRIAWTLVDRRSKLKRRVYDFNPMFGKKSDEVATKLAERFNVDLSGPNGDGDGDGDFDVDLGDAEGGGFRPVILLFDDPARREEVAEELIDVCESIIEVEKGERDGRVPLNTTQKANGLLAGIDMTRAAASSLPAIDKQLDAIQTHVARLKAAVQKQKDSKDAA